MTAKQLILNGYLPLKNENKSIVFSKMIETQNLFSSERFIKKIKYDIQQLDEETKKEHDIADDYFEDKHITFEVDVLRKEVKINYFSPHTDYGDIKNIEDLKDIENRYISDLQGEVNQTEISFIYLIKSALGYKIGKANNPFSRFSSIQTGNADKLHLIHLFPVNKDLCRDIEKKLHFLFKNKRIIGEWFTLNEEDIFTIESLYHSSCIYLPKIHQKIIDHSKSIYNIYLESYKD
jgi:hypothetical protein